MARTPCCPVYYGLILFAVLIPNGLLVLGVFEAGKAIIVRPLQKSSFWTSAGGNYTLGFQAVNGGTDYLLSIWLSEDANKSAIWWPSMSPLNHAEDPTVKENASFQFTSQGSLELYSPTGTLLWSTNTNSSYAYFNDTGNLVLFNRNKPSEIAWQSFEDSRDSLMLVGLEYINVTSKSSLLRSRRNQSSHAEGRFRLQTKGDQTVELYGKDYAGNDFKYAEEKMNTIREYQDPSYGVRKLTLESDGNLKIYSWQYSLSTSWIMLWQILEDECRLGSPCGPFGICQRDVDEKFICSCPIGYTKKSADYESQGCENPIILSYSLNKSCNLSTDISVEEVANADYYFNDRYIKWKVDMTKEDCKQICSNDCNCMAAVYANQNLDNQSSENATCVVKGNTASGFLMNGYYSPGSTLYIKVKTIKRNYHWVMWLAIAAAVLIVVGFGAFLIWQRRKHACPVFGLGRPKPEYVDIAGDIGSIRFYRHDELVIATSNFREPLGRGGFGTVFKGWLAMDNTVFDNSGMFMVKTGQQMRAVAVKVLRGFEGKRRMESYSQFKAEINTLGKVHHVNLVSLLGYSYSTETSGALNENSIMLVYECMEKGSLDTYLSTGRHTTPKLAWHTRYSIAVGIARGMAYLHHDCSPPILHCDIKPHNILLDDSFVAKVADFGFARCINPHGHIILSSVHGTHGYIAPEWLTNGELTFKVDVYSFGKLLLELVRGFKVHGGDGLTMPLVEWAIECMSYGAVVEFMGSVDDEDALEFHPLRDEGQKTQQQEIDKLRLLKVGLWCIQQKAEARPSMLRVVQLIEGSITMEDPPMPPISFNAPPRSKQSFSARTYHGESSLSGR